MARARWPWFRVSGEGAIHFTLAGRISWAWRATSVDSCLFRHRYGRLEAVDPKHAHPDESEVDTPFGGLSNLIVV